MHDFSLLRFHIRTSNLFLAVSQNISLVDFQISLNIEGIKYNVELTKGGPGSYLLRLNKSEVHAEAHTLRDGGLLVQVWPLNY